VVIVPVVVVMCALVVRRDLVVDVVRVGRDLEVLGADPAVGERGV
jgi:hypothetical protein